jgi:hyperosmotically inducible protein
MPPSAWAACHTRQGSPLQILNFAKTGAASIEAEAVRSMKSKLLGQALIASMLLAGTVLGADKNSPNLPRTDADISKSVQHNLLTYPYYSIWDDISYKVENGRVSLYGAVTQPIKKSDIQNIVAKLPGVEGVQDNIEVLPLSDNDNLLRRQIAASIYRFPSLSRYGMGTHPSIHIIVDNGHVTLTGVVDTQADKDVAGVRASAAGLSFGPIVNSLQVVRPSKT